MVGYDFIENPATIQDILEGLLLKSTKDRKTGGVRSICGIVSL